MAQLTRRTFIKGGTLGAAVAAAGLTATALAEEAADAMELDLPALTLTRELYEELAEGGFENKGTQSLYCLYDPQEE